MITRPDLTSLWNICSGKLRKDVVPFDVYFLALIPFKTFKTYLIEKHTDIHTHTAQAYFIDFYRFTAGLCSV